MERTKQQMRDSQLRWSAWNSEDCAMQTESSQGGSIYPFEKAICLSDHTAVRAIELQNQIDWWLS
jgi:uncharacterized protein YecT (DUF1311 family)